MSTDTSKAFEYKPVWLACRFPDWALNNALAIYTGTREIMLVSKSRTVIAATEHCQRAGVQLGMPLATAQLLATADCIERNFEHENTVAEQILNEFYALTPYLCAFKPDDYETRGQWGVLFEVSKSVRLFGGLQSIVEAAVHCLQRYSLNFSLACADSAEAAWLMSYVERDDHHSDLSRLESESLLNLPLQYLQGFPEEKHALLDMGFSHFAALLKQIREQGWFGLQKRFSPEFITYLQRVFVSQLDGEAFPRDLFYTAATRPAVYEPALSYSDTLSFDYPLTQLEHLRDALQRLLQNFVVYLLKTQQRCSGVCWQFEDIYRQTQVLPVPCEAFHRDASLLYELSWIRLEQQGLPFEVDQLSLCEPRLSPCSKEVSDVPMFKSGNIADAQALHKTLARLQARLGENKVYKLRYQHEILPEFATANTAVTTVVVDDVQAPHKDSPRPAWMFKNPVPIGRAQNQLYWRGRLQLIRGPERLESQWWAEFQRRDYFVAMREDYTRLWVYHDLEHDTWYVQGVF